MADSLEEIDAKEQAQLASRPVRDVGESESAEPRSVDFAARGVFGHHSVQDELAHEVNGWDMHGKGN